MQKKLFAVILCCFSLFATAQEKVQFEGTIRIHKSQENKQREAQKQQLVQDVASSQKGVIEKAMAKSIAKSANKKLDRAFAHSGVEGEFDIIRKVKGNKVIEFTPSLGKISIYDLEFAEQIDVYLKYKVAVKSHCYVCTGILKIYKNSNKIGNTELVTKNGILCNKLSEQHYLAADYENLNVYLSIDSKDLNIVEEVTSLIEETIPDSLFEVPAQYKFVSLGDLGKLQMKDKTGFVTSYKSGDSVPDNFWDFK